MTKIVVTSDLHCDPDLTSEQQLCSFVARVNAADPDVFIIAGDIGVGKFFGNCLKILGDIDATDKALVLGNHDLWRQEKITPRGYLDRLGISSRRLFDDVCLKKAETHGFKLLRDNPIKVGQTTIIGNIGWYDYSAVPEDLPDEYLEKNKSNFTNDGNYLDRDWDDLKFAEKCQKKLIHQLEDAEHDPATDRVIVVTHMPVFQTSQKPKTNVEPAVDAYYYNLTLGNKIKTFPKVTHVISAHIHRLSKAAVRREDMPPINAWTVPSDYGEPDFIEFEVEPNET